MALGKPLPPSQTLSQLLTFVSIGTAGRIHCHLRQNYSQALPLGEDDKAKPVCM